MNPRVLLAFSAALLACLPVHAAEPRSKEATEAAVRLQIFLDRADFAPGKIDGCYGEFTLKALALYRQAKGETPTPAAPTPEKPAKKKGKEAKASPPDVNGLDLESINPVFLSYTVTAEDLKAVGDVADTIAGQAKQKSLPYKTAAEAIAEKFHTDIDFLIELNRGKTAKIKAGDVLTVPNVEPFELTEVKDLKPGSELAANEVEEADDSASAKKPKDKGEKEEKPASDTAPSGVSVQVEVKTNMLSVYDGTKLIAAYPVTIGSDRTESPLGDWKVRGVAKMPNFRYDKAMLNKGERSSDFKLLPPGPNNPVGIIWIQLNKKGIGLHGTDNPDAIGRNASHGCIRLANWDVVRLAGKVKAGVPVSIR